MTPDDHPPDEIWEALAMGELDAPGRAAVMTHVVACTRCARTWRAIRQVAHEARAFDPGVPAGAPTERPVSDAVIVPFRKTRRVLIAAGFAAIAAAAVLVFWLRGGSTPQFDGTDGVRGDGTAQVELLAPTAARLAWRPVAAAESYIVEVFTLDGRPHWRGETITATEIVVAPPLAAGEYRWQVAAWAHGRRIAVSRAGRFVVAN